MRRYEVEYKMHSCGDVMTVEVTAKNKAEAWALASWRIIPCMNNGEYAYSAWVAAVVNNKGERKHFNTFEGKPY